MQGKPPKVVGIKLNLKKIAALGIVQNVVAWLIRNGISVRLPAEAARDCGLEKFSCPDNQFYQGLDCLLVLGGDGTLLQAARSVVGRSIPLLGVNLGHLGFLTELEVADLYEGLDRLVKGDYHLEERMMLRTEVIRFGQMINTTYALNDVVVAKGSFARIIDLECYIDNNYFTTYRGDGIIMATPTGSTAYSLSAGGPIVCPTFEVILLTPICPHTFYSRPLVISPRQTVKIAIAQPAQEIIMTIDGQTSIRLEQTDQIIVSRAELSTTLIKLRGRHFFEVLRGKLTPGET